MSLPFDRSMTPGRTAMGVEPIRFFQINLLQMIQTDDLEAKTNIFWSSERVKVYLG